MTRQKFQPGDRVKVTMELTVVGPEETSYPHINEGTIYPWAVEHWANGTHTTIELAERPKPHREPPERGSRTVTGIPADVLRRAVEAAAEADYRRCYPKGPGLDVDPDVIPSGFCDSVRHIVAAALAEVLPNAQAVAWGEGYDAAAKQHPTTTFLGARNPYKKETP